MLPRWTHDVVVSYIGKSDVARNTFGVGGGRQVVIAKICAYDRDTAVITHD